MRSDQQQRESHKNPTSDKMQRAAKKQSAVHKHEVLAALHKWGKGLVSISQAYADQDDYTAVAEKVLKESYAFAYSEVLFKPTLAAKIAFRTNFDGALSYFIGGNSAYPEDRGFALNPWAQVDFEIAGVITGENHGIVMGNKLLKQVNGSTTIANFTMGFIRTPEGDLKINLHHSSLPYSPT